MDLRKLNIKCPICESSLQSGTTTIGYDVQMVKRCHTEDCNFWMIIVIPNDDFEYSVKRERKQYDNN